MTKLSFNLTVPAAAYLHALAEACGVSRSYVLRRAMWLSCPRNWVMLTELVPPACPKWTDPPVVDANALQGSSTVSVVCEEGLAEGFKRACVGFTKGSTIAWGIKQAGLEAVPEEVE